MNNGCLLYMMNVCLLNRKKKNKIKSIVNVTLINQHHTPSPPVTVLGSAIFSLKINSLRGKSILHGRKGPLDHYKNIKSNFSRLKATCGTKCSETWQMSRCSSKHHVQQTGVTKQHRYTAIAHHVKW